MSVVMKWDSTPSSVRATGAAYIIIVVKLLSSPGIIILFPSAIPCKQQSIINL